MFKANDEKVLLLLYRISKTRHMALMGVYGPYNKAERKIRKMERKIVRLGGDPDQYITLQTNK